MISGLKVRYCASTRHIEIPPTRGIEPLWILRASGLSTKPTFFATLRIKKSVAKEEKKIKLSSKNIKPTFIVCGRTILAQV